MKKFKFKFDTVLQVRKAREIETLRMLSLAQQRYQSEIKNKSDLQEQLKKSFERIANLGGNATSIMAFQFEESYIRLIKHRLIQADQAISRASRSVQKTMSSYLFSKKQSRVMEVLHDKALSEFKKDFAKKEQRSLDDIVIMRERFQEEF